LKAYYIGVGYEDEPLPPDLPCSQDFLDSFCSITDVRSLLGKAQFRLLQAESLEAFEAAVFDLSFDSQNFQIPQGFYTFMYSYDGSLKSHAILHDSFGLTLPQIIVKNGLGTTRDGLTLSQAFLRAAEGDNDGWVQYQWRNDGSENPYTKIAAIVKIVFDTQEYYLGVGYTFAMDSEGLSEGPTPNEACSADYNPPCAFRSTLALSSHTLSHAISSPRSVNDIFRAISYDETFRQGQFYAFAYTFDGTCMAHGANRNYVGLRLTDVFELNNIPLDANLLHETFRAAAEKGGGWVLYDWLVPGVANSEFEKISYIFRINIQGTSYYGGVGFNHKRFPVVTDTDHGLTKNRQPIPCSQKYGLPCSETNTQAILGQTLVDLTLGASKSIVTVDEDREIDLQNVLYAITDQVNTEYTVNDFFVSVFSTEGGSELCFQEGDGSGCCLAHGADPTNVGLSWSEILEKEEISSIQGSDLHNRLVLKSNSGSGWLEYPWSSVFGEARTKRSWVARFRSNDGTSYYVVAEYLKTPLPATCDQCPQDQECTSGDQAFCADKPDPPLREDPVDAADSAIATHSAIATPICFSTCSIYFSGVRMGMSWITSTIPCICCSICVAISCI
jgi:signal transduction histidine kinase